MIVAIIYISASYYGITQIYIYVQQDMRNNKSIESGLTKVVQKSYDRSTMKTDFIMQQDIQ